MADPMPLIWRKRLSKSDAQEPTKGRKMPFLRLTRGHGRVNQQTWFRNHFFSGLQWESDAGSGNNDETAYVDIWVIILGRDLGLRRMLVDFKPDRIHNHAAPTTHLHYDEVTRTHLEDFLCTGRLVKLQYDGEEYILEVS